MQIQNWKLAETLTSHSNGLFLLQRKERKIYIYLLKNVPKNHYKKMCALKIYIFRGFYRVSIEWKRNFAFNFFYSINSQKNAILKFIYLCGLRYENSKHKTQLLYINGGLTKIILYLAVWPIRIKFL